MTSLDPTTLAPVQLVPMLHAWADGSFSDESAVNLLAVHGTWLGRRDFLKDCVEAVDDGWTRDGPVPMAVVDWQAAAGFVRRASASSSETAILRLACSLAGVDTGALRELTAGLDRTNTARVLDALAHRAGWHEQGTRHTTDGHQRADVAGGVRSPRL
jgi:hypothetical protein